MSWDDLTPQQRARLEAALSRLRVKGGQTLAGGVGVSPRVAVRLPAALQQQVREVAARRGVPVSAVVREALEAWLEGPIP